MVSSAKSAMRVVSRFIVDIDYCVELRMGCEQGMRALLCGASAECSIENGAQNVFYVASAGGAHKTAPTMVAEDAAEYGIFRIWR